MNRLTLRQKLWLPLILSWLCLLSITLWNTWKTRTLRPGERQRNLQNISRSVFNIIKDYGRIAQDGKLTTNGARVQALACIKIIRYDKDGYFSISQTNSMMVMHPTKAEMNGKDMPGFTDPARNHLFKEISHIGKNDGGFADYLWPKPGARTPQSRKSYVLYYQPWDWCLVTGTYIDDIETTFRTSLVKALGLLLGIDLLMTMVVVAVTRSLQRQLGGEPAYAARIADRIAAGDLTVPIETRSGGRDSVLYTMAQMQRGLTGTVGNIKSSAGSITNATKQVAAGSADLSQRTEQQASSLEETASSMEELTNIVKQSADDARQASTLAVNASDIAVKGEEVVGRVVETMFGINESGKKIADIISVIEGIAFQTGILTLSATVEAACTDEQSQDFVVVAGEVRSLAQRSVSVTKEIKGLVGDSVGRVQNGSALVKEAGVVIQGVVAAVKRVTDIVGEISAASDEQSFGIEQVNQAMNQMDEVTQQNVTLAEQAATTALSLEGQMQSLRTTVKRFRV